jgi:hypothetical protein
MWAAPTCAVTAAVASFPCWSSAYAIASVCHYLSFSSLLETKVFSAAWGWERIWALSFWLSKAEKDATYSDSNFFARKGELKVPSPLLIFHTEFAQKKVPGYPAWHPDVAGRVPTQLDLLHWHRQLGTWAPYPFSGFSQCKSLARDWSHVPMTPICSSTWRGHQLFTRRGPTHQESPKGSCWLLWAHSNPDAPNLPCCSHMLDWIWSVHGVLYLWKSRCCPPAAARTKAREPINSAILRTPLLKKHHCFVVTNIRSICWMYTNILSYICPLKMSEVFFLSHLCWTKKGFKKKKSPDSSY